MRRAAHLDESRGMGLSNLRMTHEEQEAFLGGLHYAIVGVPADGHAPILTPCWYRYDPDEGIVFTCLATSEKARRLRVGSLISVNVQEAPGELFQQSYVTVEGEVASIDDQAGMDELRRLAVRYYGPEGSKQYLAVVPEGLPWLVVRVRPKRWLSRDYKKALPPA